MSTLTEDQALAQVDAARAKLAAALDDLRQARGEPADEPCRFCHGSGSSPRYRETDEDKACFRCKGIGRQPASFPWIVTRVAFEEGKPTVRPSLGDRATTWVKVRPCAPEFQGKTYLGWLLGELAQSPMARLQKDGTLELSLAMHNPAIFVPSLGRIVYGYESWWGALERPEDLQAISDLDIENVWYVQVLKDLTSPPSPEATVD